MKDKNGTSIFLKRYKKKQHVLYKLITLHDDRVNIMAADLSKVKKVAIYLRKSHGDEDAM